MTEHVVQWARKRERTTTWKIDLMILINCYALAQEMVHLLLLEQISVIVNHF